MIRVVIDTNLYVSALINNNSRVRLNKILDNQYINIILDNALLTELHDVISRPKFKKYISFQQIESFLELIVERSIFTETTSIVQYSPDPKDDFLLALCQDSKADYLLTGNKVDLLDLKSFGQTNILSLTDFLSLNL